MLAIYDNEDIYFLSTIHKINDIDTRKRNSHGNVIRKLTLVDDYNKNVGLTEMMNSLMKYPAIRKSMKWTKFGYSGDGQPKGKRKNLKPQAKLSGLQDCMGEAQEGIRTNQCRRKWTYG